MSAQSQRPEQQAVFANRYLKRPRRILATFVPLLMISLCALVPTAAGAAEDPSVAIPPFEVEEYQRVFGGSPETEQSSVRTTTAGRAAPGVNFDRLVAA